MNRKRFTCWHPSRRTFRGRKPLSAPGRTLTACEPLESRACLAAGGLDGSFGIAGKALGAFNAGWKEAAAATAVDSQGRVLVAGTVDFGMSKEFAIFRFLPDGTPDNSFAGAGHKYVSFNLGGTNDDSAVAIAVDDVGRIVVAGTVTTGAHGKDIAVCRLTANGLLDQTFDADGKVTVGFDLGGTNDDTCGGMMIDPHGRIVVAGSVALGNAGTEFGVVRLTAAGQADPAFDVDGKAVVSFSNGLPSEAIPTGVCSDSHGSLIVSGIVSQMVGKPPHAQIYGGVARLLVTGAPDQSFGTLGRRVVASNVIGQPLTFSSVAVDAADRIVLAGTRGFGISVTRLRTNGKFDPTFGVGGRASIAYAFAPGVPGVVVPVLSGGAVRVAIDAAGRIVVGATAGRVPGIVDVGLVRLTVKGRVDKTFDGDGRAAVPFNAGGDDQDMFGGLAIDGQGRIVVAATVSRDSLGDTDIGVARLFS